MGIFRTRYRVSRDRYYPSFWAVNYRYWFWPFWSELGNGLLRSKQEAYDLIETIQVEK